VFNFEAVRDSFADQHKLNEVILLDLLKNSIASSPVVYLSSILHQPLIDYVNIEQIIETIKSSV